MIVARPPNSAETPRLADESCRTPALVVFCAAAAWLVTASILSLIGSIKFHSPTFLADVSWLTYGRVRPAFMTSFVYGFLIQSALGVTLWIFSRLGAVAAVARPMAIFGAFVLNVGVCAGVAGILIGDSSGFEWFDMPGYASGLYILGYLSLAVSAALTFQQQTASALYVSHWFLLAALLWLPWIFSTALMLLVWFPARGITQAVCAWWYAGNLRVVWLWLFGLGTLFYFLPKLARRELHSRYLALMTFWILILCGSWAGIPAAAPIPSWIPVASRLGSMMCLVVGVSVFLNLSSTLRGACSASWKAVPEFRFFALAFALFLVLNLAEVLTAFSGVEAILAFTWFVPSENLANYAGFGALIVFGAIYHITPRLFGDPWPFPKILRAHVWVSAVGLLTWLLPQALGGILQGVSLQNPEVPFVNTTLITLRFLRLATLGELLFLAGNLMLFINLAGLALSFYRRQAGAFSRVVTRDLRPAGEVGA